MAIQSKPEAGRIRGQIRVLLERTSREARARRLPHIAINVAGPSVGSATLPTKRVFEAVAVLSYFVAGAEVVPVVEIVVVRIPPGSGSPSLPARATIDPDRR